MDKQCNTCQKTGEDVLSCVCKTVQYCSKECQKKDWKTHKKDCPPIVFKEVEGKGKGLFATRNIAQTSVIFAEEPVLAVEAGVDDHDCEKKLLKDFNKLPDVTAKAILNLYDRDGEDFPSLPEKLNRIVFTNSIRMNLTGMPTQNMLFLRVSGINHSCKPNVAWVAEFSLKDSAKVSVKASVRALVPIKAGDELTSNYSFRPFLERGEYGMCREERRLLMKERYSLDCLCNVCSENDKEDDELRKKYQSLDRQLGAKLEEGTKEAVDMAEKKLEIGRKIDSQLICRDLRDCMKALSNHMVKLRIRTPVISRCKELVEEYDKIKVCFDHSAMNTESLVFSLDQLSLLENFRNSSYM